MTTSGFENKELLLILGEIRGALVEFRTAMALTNDRMNRIDEDIREVREEFSKTVTTLRAEVKETNVGVVRNGTILALILTALAAIPSILSFVFKH